MCHSQDGLPLISMSMYMECGYKYSGNLTWNILYLFWHATYKNESYIWEWLINIKVHLWFQGIPRNIPWICIKPKRRSFNCNTIWSNIFRPWYTSSDIYLAWNKMYHLQYKPVHETFLKDIWCGGSKFSIAICCWRGYSVLHNKAHQIFITPT